MTKVLVIFLLLAVSCSTKRESKMAPKNGNAFPAAQPAESDPLDSLYGSFVFNSSTRFQVDKFSTLGKVWGFLKYYHPAVTAGGFDWDSELCKILPAIDAASSTLAFNKIVLRWIDSLGTVPACRSCLSPQSSLVVKQEPDFSWLDRPVLLDAKIRRKLKYIFSNRSAGSNYYFEVLPAGNPKFIHENNHDSRLYPIAAIRMLALFRYWNTIQYFFPNKQLIGENWNTILDEYVPRFNSAKNAFDYAINCRYLTARINDSHANVWGENRVLFDHFGRNFATLKTAVIDDKLVVTGYYLDTLEIKKTVKPGDIIEEIDGKPVADLIKQLLPVIPGSNMDTKLRDITREMLFRTTGNEIKLKIDHGNGPEHYLVPAFDGKIVFKQYLDSSRSGNCFRLLPGNTGYLNSGKYQSSQLKSIVSKAARTNGMIIDLRPYPKDEMMTTLGPILNPHCPLIGKTSQVEAATPGRFYMHDLAATISVPQAHYDKPMVVLVNAETQSEAEYSVMELQCRANVIVIGSQTAGADGNVSEVRLPGRILAWFSSIGIYYPDGTETQRTGIKVDRLVKPTIKGIRQGRDEIFEAGLSMLREMMKNAD